MIGAGNRAEPCRDTGAPAFHDGPALPKIFRAFIVADDRIEAAARRRVPEQRARGPGRCLVEMQRLVDGGIDQRFKVEQARNGVGRHDKVFG